MSRRLLKLLAVAACTRRHSFWRAAVRQRAMAVLCYHRVAAGGDALGLAVDETEFELQMHVLARHRWLRPVTADAFCALWRGEAEHDGRIPVLVTFDDGYRDNLTRAAPILLRHGIPAIVFVASGVLDGRPLWYDVIARAIETHREALLAQLPIASVPAAGGARDWVRALLALPGERWREACDVLHRHGMKMDWQGRYLSAEDLRTWLGLGFTLGAHTVTHPRLSAMTPAIASREIRDCREALKQATGRTVRYFAYPFGARGDYAPEHVSMLRESGFEMAFTTVAGPNRAGGNAFEIARKCIDGGLFAHPGTRFSPTLFLGDLMAVPQQLRRLCGCAGEAFGA